ncbi:Imm8 family immunity protein [Comamonas sp. JC664]|uniref:Imm8 family immunity protein n=1 Tax=Comamonas sp. JC664 TaxID=2801917 RepID=UPI00174DCB76|nr:Imm8 family immunity protein [Comamonas sp. JC664]MBL0694487.1 immunity 8 family protein [Comamonas sp. JC664]GHG77828.1 hypothetical protein GCM10012319_28220 [Comamonas sp. KCTC 72670]
MKLAIRSVGVWGHPNIRKWTPENPEVMAEVVFVDIGPRAGGKGEAKKADTFTIRVATPAGLDALESRNGILAIRPLLVMRRYDFNNLFGWLEQTVASCEADSWMACVEKLRLYFDWEYDGMKR